MEDVKIEYYGAPWCGPCRILAPVLDELKAAGWNIEKIDIDKNPSKASVNNVMAVPTFIIYRNGVMVTRFAGAKSKQSLLMKFNRAAG